MRRPVRLFPEHRDDLGPVPFLFPLRRAPPLEAQGEEGRVVEQKPSSLLSRC